MLLTKHVCNWNKCFTVQNKMNPRFKCEATENVLLPAACVFYNPWETQRELDIF